MGVMRHTRAWRDMWTAADFKYGMSTSQIANKYGYPPKTGKEMVEQAIRRYMVRMAPKPF